MTAPYAFQAGSTPLLVSMPHSGTELPDAIAARLTDRGRKLPDTDWHVPRLYDFAGGLGASLLQANFSRYVIDLNRPPDDASLYPGQATTGLCPVELFDGTPLYRQWQAPTDDDIGQRRERYWQPYHDKLAEELERLRAAFGYALLYDAHSIASQVPRLFDGQLSDLNLGTARGESCMPSIERAIAGVLGASDFTHVVNGRFVGGYITRHYGNPRHGVHAVQMEIAQGSYMDEMPRFPYNERKAARLQPVLKEILQAFLASASAA